MPTRSRADAHGGSIQTLAALRNPQRRPDAPRDRLPPELQLPPRPEQPLELDKPKLAANLRSAPRGKAGGPSGTTAEHLESLLEDEDVTFFQAMGEQAARAEVPRAVAEALLAVDRGQKAKPLLKTRWPQSPKT